MPWTLPCVARASSLRAGDVGLFGSQTIAVFISYVFRFYIGLVTVWCILSWLPIPQQGIIADVAGAIDKLVRPYVDLFRRFIPPLAGLDFSPIVAIVVLGVIERLILSILLRM